MGADGSSTHPGSQWAPPQSHTAPHGPVFSPRMWVGCGERKVVRVGVLIPCSALQGYGTGGKHPQPPTPLIITAGVIVAALIVLRVIGIGSHICGRRGLGWSLLLGNHRLLLPFSRCFGEQEPLG